MRARLQRNRVIRCRLGHEAAAKPVIHSRGGPALLCHLRSHATAQRQTPKRPSKPPEGTVGAAPLSKSVTAVGLLDCGSASASCLDGGTACGLVGVALAVFVSADCRGSVFGLLAAAVGSPGGSRLCLRRCLRSSLAPVLRSEQIAEEATNPA
jgi:hypothetical protein